MHCAYVATTLATTTIAKHSLVYSSAGSDSVSADHWHTPGDRFGSALKPTRSRHSGIPPWAAALQRRPELVREARDEVAKRMATVAPPEAKTLREWQEVLDGMSIPRLRRWLVGRSERATRLRQSMPLVLLRAADEHSGSKRGQP